MKIFIYKTLFIALVFFILFQLTFGLFIKNYEKKILNNLSSDKIEFIKEKTRNELKRSLEKDRVLNSEDAELLNKFLKKIMKEINF